MASDEYLDYAITNREEWKVKGRNVVEGYIEEFWRKADLGEFGDLAQKKEQN